jgi:tetratricopeptide (TPR) repeat protein
MASEFQPYVGPRPFELKDQDRFFGRESESSELLSRVIAHAAVLFYSQSGAGKTSLLNASLIPLLKEEGFEVLPMARVRGLVPKEIQPEKISNIYVFNVLMSWSEGQVDPARLTSMTLTDFLKSRVRPRSREGHDAPRVAIFDQFEELFTFYPERWADRQDFFDQINEALEDDRLLRAIFGMREDYIAELDPYIAVLPEKLQIRFRLERLREDDALRAITRPLEKTDCSFAEGVPEQMVSNLLKVPVETAAGVTHMTGEFIEPVQLQVVCQTLWQKLLPSQDKIITLEHLKAFGDVDEALSYFYENSVVEVAAETGVKEGALRRWFEHTLITPSGTRGTVWGGGKEVGGIPVDAIKRLVNRHIIRGELRGGARWYELTHDRLIEPIKTSNQRWLLQRSGSELTRQRLEAKADQWVRSGRDSQYLLSEAELLEAKRWLDSPSATDVGYSDALLALIQASRAAVEEAARQRDQQLLVEQQRRAEAEAARAEEQQQRVAEQTLAARRMRWLAAGLAVMFVLAVASTVLAVFKAADASKQAQIAQSKQKEAQTNFEQAQRANTIATEQRNLAQQEKEKAEDARQDAELEKEKAESLAKQTEILAHSREIEAKRARQLEADARREANNAKTEADRANRETERANREAELAQKRSYANSLLNRGTIYDMRKEYELAEISYEAALRTWKALPGEERSVADTLNYLGLLYYHQKKYKGAEDYYQQALAVSAKIPNKNYLVTTYSNLGLLYNDMSQYQDAASNYLKAITIQDNDSPSKVWNLLYLGIVYQNLAKYDEAETFLKQALELSKIQKENGEGEDNLTRTFSRLGVLYIDWGRFAEAERYLAEARKIIEKQSQVNPDDEQLQSHIDVLNGNMALVYLYEGKYAEAEAIYNDTLKESETAEYANQLQNLAFTYYEQGRYKEAEQYTLRSLAIYRRQTEPDYDWLSGALSLTGRLYRLQAKYTEAEKYLNEAMHELLKVYNQSHPYVGLVLNGQAMLYADQHDYKRAEPLIEESLGILSKSLGQTNWRVAVALITKADIYAGEGRSEEAARLYRQAIESLEHTFGPEHPDLASALNGLANVYVEQNQYADAEPLFKRALAIREKMLGAEHPETAESLNDYGRLYFKQNKYPEAEDYYKRALAIREKALGAEHPNVAETLENYAALLRQTKRAAEANKMEARAKAIKARYTQVKS